jgi:hypothetical protein
LNANTVKSELSRYGYKGACSLIPVTSTTDQENLTVGNVEGAQIDLLSRVVNYPSSRIDNKTIFANDRRVIAAPDSDWSGSVMNNDIVVIDGERYSIVNIKTQKEKQAILYVEIHARG